MAQLNEIDAFNHLQEKTWGKTAQLKALGLPPKEELKEIDTDHVIYLARTAQKNHGTLRAAQFLQQAGWSLHAALNILLNK